MQFAVINLTKHDFSKNTYYYLSYHRGFSIQHHLMRIF
jgi:hypothetical protein